MKNIYLLLFLLSVFVSCVAPDNKNVSVMIDTSLYKTDKFISNILIDSVRYQAAVLRDKMDSAHKKFTDSKQSPITLLIFSENDNQLLFKQKFSAKNDLPFWFYKLFKYNQKSIDSAGHLFFAATSYYGGSSSETELFLIRRKDAKIILDSIFKVNGELSYELADQAGNKILLMEGVWKSDENEAHFSEHQIKITTYDCSRSPVTKSISLITKNKYSLPDNDEEAHKILELIKKTEPNISKFIPTAF
jgi:hypothetical protein